MNFLTLPPLHDSFALFGSGYAVQALQHVTWLNSCDVFYWGDLDAQGFQILSQLRAHIPRTQSVMMEQLTLQAFKAFVVIDEKATLKTLTGLTDAEQAVYDYLATNKLRLEQVHILQSYANEALTQKVQKSRPPFGFMQGTGEVNGDIVEPVEQNWDEADSCLC